MRQLKKGHYICTLCKTTRASLRINSLGTFRKEERELDQRKHQILLSFALHSNNFSGTNGLIPNRGFTSGSESFVFVLHQFLYFILHGVLMKPY